MPAAVDFCEYPGGQRSVKGVVVDEQSVAVRGQRQARAEIGDSQQPSVRTLEALRARRQLRSDLGQEVPVAREDPGRAAPFVVAFAAERDGIAVLRDGDLTSESACGQARAGERRVTRSYQGRSRPRSRPQTG